MRLHAIVTDFETARAAVEGGPTVVQLRLKGAATEEVVVPRERPESRSSVPSPMRRRSVRLSQLGELGLLAELERRGLARQIENDAALLDGGLVATQDALVEGVHFRLDRLTWRELGYRAAA